MASTKSREKTKKKNKNKKLSTGKNWNEMRPEELRRLSPDEKMQYLLENGHLVKDKLFNEVAMKQGKLKKEALAIGPNSLLTKSGKLRKRNKHHLKFLDQILKSEFNIVDTTSDHDKQTNKPTNGDNNINNNDMDTSNQNNTLNGSNDNSLETETSKDTNKTNDNYVIIEVEKFTETVAPKCISSKEDEPKKTKKNKEAKINTEKKLNAISKEKLDKYTKDMLCKRLNKLKHVKLSNGIVLSIKQYQCDYCQKSFNYKSCLRRHINTHLNIRPFACAYCPRKFVQCCNWRVHLKKVHPDQVDNERYLCIKCKKTFFLKEKLQLHLEEHRKEENAFKCVFCDKAFSQSMLLKEHEKEHMRPGRYKCAICPMTYGSRSRYSLHIKSHLDVKDLRCQYCHKEFGRACSIKRHIETFHGGVRVKCPICNKMLKGHLTEHMRTHENDRPHECKVCGQRFTQSTQLNVHKRSHTGAQPYTCRICRRPFKHSNALLQHIRIHTGEKPFPCAMCPIVFSQLPHMKSHMRRIHGKEKYYKCEKCSTFFKLKTELEIHEETCVTNIELTLEEKIQASLEEKPDMSISKMRFLLALLFTMIAPKEKLKYLGFNKRLIDDILVESVEAMGYTPCKDESLTPLMRLKYNIAMLLRGTVPEDQMAKFRKSNKTTEELLELLTGEKNKKE